MNNYALINATALPSADIIDVATLDRSVSNGGRGRIDFSSPFTSAGTPLHAVALLAGSKATACNGVPALVNGLEKWILPRPPFETLLSSVATSMMSALGRAVAFIRA